MRHAEAVERCVESVRPDAVVDAAAFHRVEECERRPDAAFAVNALGALHVARAAEAAAAGCIFVSTDYVFGGEREDGYAEDDPPAPVNVYGASKAAGEHLVRLACRRATVVRAAGLFGHAGSSGKGGNFVDTMLAKAAAGEPISVVDDIRSSPTATADLAQRVLELLEQAAPPGVYHAANSGGCSWFEFAAAVFELAGVSADLSPRSAGEQAPSRPRCSVLLDTRSGALGLSPMRPWRDALAAYLEGRAPAAGA